MTTGERPEATTPEGVRSRYVHARDRLGGAQKTKAGVGAYLRFVNRPIGGRLAAGGYGLGLTPDHLTAVSALLATIGIAGIALVDPTPSLAVGVTVALLASYAFDSADGQLARVRGDGTRAGEWLDHVVDVAKTAALHAAVLISLHRFADLDTGAWLLVPIGFGIVSVTFFFAMMLRDQLGGRPDPPGGEGRSVVRSLVLLPMDHGALCLVVLTLAHPPTFLAAYTGLFAFTVAFVARSLVKTFRALGST